MAPRIAISTLTLGRPEAGHTLPIKIRIAAETGFDGVEINWFCLKAFAESMPGLEEADRLREAAKQTRALVDELKLETVSLAPLMNYDGLTDRGAHAVRLAEANLWFELAHILNVQMVQMPACMLNPSETVIEWIIPDLVELADIGASYTPPIQVAYEFTGFSTHTKTWQQALDIVLKANHSNLFVCLDTFHLGSHLYHSQQTPPSVKAGPDDFYSSMKALSQIGQHASKFCLLQLSDAYAFNSSLHDPSLNEILTWSRKLRNFPCEEEGILPVLDMAKAVCEMGYDGWWSFETFELYMWDESPGVPNELAKRAWTSWQNVKAGMGFQD